jgi:DNA-directed RNA polymerase subunit H (RpoH/RPB5)
MEIQPVIDFKMSRKTVIEMLLDRKYKIIKPIKTDIYVEENTKELYTIMNFDDSLIVGENDIEKIYVYFIFAKIGIKIANSIIDKILKGEMQHTILVCRGGYTTFAEQTIKTTCKEQKVDIELFLQDKLLYNITKNFTQPQKIEHVNDKKRIKLLLQTLSIKKKQGLLIQSNDPLNKYYHGKVGEMYKVTTRGGQLDYYNIV